MQVLIKNRLSTVVDISVLKVENISSAKVQLFVHFEFLF